jgi:hypothetical protein
MITAMVIGAYRDAKRVPGVAMSALCAVIA